LDFFFLLSRHCIGVCVSGTNKSLMQNQLHFHFEFSISLQ
jgi:hypothetical protein